MKLRKIFFKKKREKLYSLLMSQSPSDDIKENIKFVTKLIPNICDMIGFDHKHPHHHLDVWEHTLYALSLSVPIFEVRLALLLHDIGKPHSYQYDGGVNHYKGHNRVSCSIAKKVLTRLEYDESTIKTVCEIILRHDTPLHKSEIQKDTDFCKLLFEVQKCDSYAHNPEFNERRIEYVEYIERLFENLK